MTFQVIEEKLPLLDCPTAGFIFTPAKRARKRSDQIELASESRERLKGPDSSGHALDSEKIDQLVRERKVAHVDANALVTELFCEKKKKSRPASEIENSLRWRTVQFQFVDPWEIDF